MYTNTVHEFELVKIFDKKPGYDSILAPTFDPACGFEPTSLIHFLAFAVWRLIELHNSLNQNQNLSKFKKITKINLKIYNISLNQDLVAQ